LYIRANFIHSLLLAALSINTTTMKYAFFTGLLAVAGVNGVRTSFVMPEEGEPVEHLRRVPEGWNDVGAPSADHKMNFRIAVRSVSLGALLIISYPLRTA
jgi:hypothetical protein